MRQVGSEMLTDGQMTNLALLLQSLQTWYDLSAHIGVLVRFGAMYMKHINGFNA